MTPTIHVRHVGSRSHIALITLRGFLDTVSAYRLQQQLSDLMEAGTAEYVLNLEWLEYISSAGLETFYTLAQKLSSRRGRLILAQVPDKIYHVLEIIGMTTFFHITTTVREALQEFDGEWDKHV
jgi:anti-sigma B factor antagonist